MRVIAGRAKGRTLQGPKSDRIRPALDKVKQAIFNILGPIEGLTVLDLFAGTGSIGIEALSRGAGHCTFVDGSKEAIELIRKNLERCQFEASATVLRRVTRVGRPTARNEMSTVGRNPRQDPPQPYDLIFIDPPYDHDLVNPTLRAIAREKLLAPNGIIVIEHSPREKVIAPDGFSELDQRKYGQTYITFLK